MNYKTVEVDLDNGVVRPTGDENLPPHGHGFLMLFPNNDAVPVKTCGELADWWVTREKLSAEELEAFASDVKKARAEG